jgi:arylsulfatase A-like enzyme
MMIPDKYCSWWWRPFALVLLVIVLNVPSCTWQKGGNQPRNVLLIAVDTLRQDHLGCYGYGRGDSKTIDDLARQGVMFTQARSAVPLTLPSFSTIFTSTYPVYHQIQQNEMYSMKDSVTTLVEVFKDAGFSTMAVIGSVALAKRHGLDQGFDMYDDDFDPVAEDIQSVGALPPGEEGLVARRRAPEVVGLAVDWLKGHSGEPFFLFLHFFDAHLPYDSPEKLPLEGYADDEVPVWAYDSEIATVNKALGDLIAVLGDLDLIENTLIVFVADHGEKVIDGAIRTIDLMPTMIDIFNLDPPENMQGVSFKDQILGDTEPPQVDSYFETYYGRLFLGWSVLKGVQWNEWKYVQAPKPELYNLAEDPGEEVNLIDEEPQIAASMRHRLNEIISGYSNPSSAMARSVPMDPEHKEALESLGYITEVVDIDAETDSLLPDPKDMMEEYSRTQVLLGRILMAGRLIQAGKYDASLKLLEGLEGAGEREWMVRYHLGLSYMGKSDDRRAEEEFWAALDHAPVGPERVRIREALRYLETKQ